MSIYAAYGTSLHPGQMARRAPHSPLITTGWLEGWRLTFGECLPEPGGALATLVEDAGRRVFVALYDLMEWDEPHLDFWQGALETPRGGQHRLRGVSEDEYEDLRRRRALWSVAGDGRAYRKVTVRARTADHGVVTAWAYVLDGYEGGMPSAIQLGELAVAAEKAGAPDWYVSELLARECLPTEL
ncbi:gamma-glutamylcyclotransferase [Nocardiopsis dassonvillei]|uniref:gamma-glutamylcyclotransferase family protein n=1 Tax=Nocardiopsis dassonvillei TaxID=2014 RepID=UPI0010EC439C|nr:gamma-glutamylcyclotransferase family protein [Nocardiopsis dassonvillei]MCP3014354.1 gamma-glutamylcyclotransferase [Nocardiopsis dassonvillei]